MKIALAQINPTVGDFAGNTRLILDFKDRAAEQGADLVVYPELCVCGYPPADLLEKTSFLARAAEALEQIAAKTVVVVRRFCVERLWLPASMANPPRANVRGMWRRCSPTAE
jgi:NAD+ synthase (glutamine-hydrolysing)